MEAKPRSKRKDWSNQSDKQRLYFRRNLGGRKAERGRELRGNIGGINPPKPTPKTPKHQTTTNKDRTSKRNGIEV